MGNSTWSDRAYHERAVTRSMEGTETFEYSRRVQSGQENRIHPSLDPKHLQVRESRDGAEHPNSNAVIVGLDVTGSMGSTVGMIHSKLPTLMGLLKDQNFLTDPQILFAAVGDIPNDRFPLQVGQFESGIEMEDNITKIILEGGGGATESESYEMLMYFGAKKTSIDCFEKRSKKGYFFMFGDELAYPSVTPNAIRKVFDQIGDTETTEQVARELKRMYNVFFVIPEQASGGRNRRVLNYWQNLLGEDYVLKLSNAAEAAQLIALQIGICEGVVSRQTTQAEKLGANHRLNGINVPAVIPFSANESALGVERV